MARIATDYVNADSAGFWHAAAEGRLVFQHCSDCGHVQFPPRHLCASCWSESVGDVASDGRGAIESVTTVRRAPLAALRDKTPYLVVAVRMDEGPRMITNLLGEGAADAAIGDRVEVVFIEEANGTLPQFRLARDGRAARP